MDKVQYIMDTLIESANDLGILLTKEQSKQISMDVITSLELWSDFSGESVSDMNRRSDLNDCITNLEKELRKEKEKVICSLCSGSGSVTESWGIRSSTSLCHKCKGDGRI